MWLVATFFLGIGNFTLHKAVLECGHPVIARIRGQHRVFARRVSLATEFVVLLVTLWLVSNGFPGWGWAYLAYSVFNAVSAWMILTNRI